MPTTVNIVEYQNPVADFTGYHNWRTMEGSGIVLYDTPSPELSSINLAHNGGWSTTGYGGFPCATYSGINVSSVTDANLNDISGFSFAAWIYYTGEDANKRMVFSQITGFSEGESWAPGLSVIIGGNTIIPYFRYNIAISDGTNVSIFQNSTPPVGFSINTWYHIAVVVHAGDNPISNPDVLYLYLNGYLVLTHALATANISTYIAGADDKPFRLGAGFYGIASAPLYLAGNLEDVWWFKNTELTAEEVFQIYKVRA